MLYIHSSLSKPKFGILCSDHGTHVKGAGPKSASVCAQAPISHQEHSHSQPGNRYGDCAFQKRGYVCYFPYVKLLQRQTLGPKVLRCLEQFKD